MLQRGGPALQVHVAVPSSGHAPSKYTVRYSMVTRAREDARKRQAAAAAKSGAEASDVEDLLFEPNQDRRGKRRKTQQEARRAAAPSAALAAPAEVAGGGTGAGPQVVEPDPESGNDVQVAQAGGALALSQLAVRATTDEPRVEEGACVCACV